MGVALTIAAGAAVTAGVAAFSYGAFHPRSRWFAPVIHRGPARGSAHGGGGGQAGDPPGAPPGRVALTFDDGPHPDVTPVLLDLLARRNVRAAFFVIGVHADRHLDLLRRMRDDGHVIGNHTYDHDYHGMCRLHRYWVDQIDRADDAIERAIGLRPVLFRPPMGFKPPFLGMIVRRRGHVVVAWSRRALDGWGADPRRIHRRLLDPARGGDVLAMHDGRAPALRAHPHPTAVLQAVGPLIDDLRGRGLEPTRLDELIGVPPYR